MNTAGAQKPEPVAKLYAKALFELAQEKGAADQVLADLGGVVELLDSSKELRHALAGYALAPEAKEKLVETIAAQAQVNDLLTRFLKLLAAKGRVSTLQSIYVAYRDLADEKKNIVRGTVTTVEPLSDAEMKDLSQAFSRKFNKQVVLDSATDKEILGGLIVKIQGLTFDGSIKTTIRRLKENLERQSI